jgi:uncharacterized protein
VGLNSNTVDLSASETRVLGCLLEKQRTTPEAYPLTLNALRLACNQSTNRDPVVDYDDETLREALHRLERRGYVRLASGRGSRAPKYRHLLQEALPLADDEHAVMCVLMLRGPQTPGELHQRAERMHRFAGLSDVQETLARPMARGLAARRERRPGQKEERYAQLLQDDEGPGSPGAGEAGHAAPVPREADGAPAAVDRGVEQDLVVEVRELRERVERLARELSELRPDGALASQPAGWQ